MKSKLIQIVTLLFSISLVLVLIFYKSGYFNKKEAPTTGIQYKKLQPSTDTINIENYSKPTILPSSKSAIIFDENKTIDIDTNKLKIDYSTILSSSKSIIIKD